MKQLFIFLHFTFCILHVQAQTQLSPKYSVDGNVKAMTSKGDTLIIGGDFGNIGIYSGAEAVFTAASDNPNLAYPKIIGSISASTPDGNGGLYICGTFRKTTETDRFQRIEHVLANFTFETSFSLPVHSLFAIGVNKLLYHSGLLYIGGDYINDINGQAVGNLSAIDVATKQFATWLPAVNTPHNITGLFISQNSLYITGHFDSIGGQARANIAAIRLNTGTVRPWNFASHWSDAQEYSDIEFYNSQMIISGAFDNDGLPNNYLHACAITDTVSGGGLDYLFSSGGLFGNSLEYLYFAANVSQIAVSGDTLFACSIGTFDTRVQALKLTAPRNRLWARYFNVIGNARDMKVKDGALYVAGENFTEVYKLDSTNVTVGNVDRKFKNALKFGTANGSLQSWFPEPLGTVFGIETIGSNIFLGGNFSLVKSQSKPSVVMLNAAIEQILPFGTRLSFSTANAFKISNNTLYVAGDHLYDNGVYIHRSAWAYNLSSGDTTAWHPPYLGQAYAIDANANHVFVGGNLTEPAGGSDRVKLLAIYKQTGALATWAPNPDGAVSSLHLSYGRLYVGGGYTHIASQARNYLASFDTASLALSPWNPSPNNYVDAITSDNHIIWAGGGFSQIGNSNCSKFGGIDNGTAKAVRIPGLPITFGDVHALYKMGCYIAAGGDLQVDATSCNGLVMYNIYDRVTVPTSTLCINIPYDVYYGRNVKALASVGRDLYLGGSFLGVNNTVNASNIERVRFPQSYADGCGEYISKQNGNWNNPSTWEANAVPPSDAKVIVRHNVTVTANATCYSLDTQGGGQVTVNTGIGLTVVN